MGVLWVVTGFLNAAIAYTGDALACVLLGFWCLAGAAIGAIGLAVFLSGLRLLSEYSDLSEPCGGTADYEKLSQLKPLLLVSTTITAVGYMLNVCPGIVILCRDSVDDCDGDDARDESRVENRVENRVQDRVPEMVGVVDEAVAQELKQQVKQLQQQMKQLQQQVRQLQLQPQPTQPDLLPRGVDAASLAKP